MQGCVGAASALLGGDVEASFGLGVRVVVGTGACVGGVVGVCYNSIVNKTIKLFY